MIGGDRFHEENNRSIKIETQLKNQEKKEQNLELQKIEMAYK